MFFQVWVTELSSRCLDFGCGIMNVGVDFREETDDDDDDDDDDTSNSISLTLGKIR